MSDEKDGGDEVRVRIFILLIFPIVFYAQDNWIWQNPLPQGNRLVEIQSVNKNKIIATGDNGTVLVSSNSGIDWDLTDLQLTSNIRAISFIDSLQGWVISTEYLFKTVDGGKTWIKSHPAVNDSSWILLDIVFLNENDGWLISDCNFYDYWNNPDQYHGRLYRTYDGGESWSEILVDPIETVEKLFVPDSQSIFIMGEEIGGCYFLRSLDSGESWTKLSVPDIVYTSSSSLFFYSKDYGWWGRYLTKDGGNTWEKSLSSPSIEDRIETINFQDLINGWMVTKYELFDEDLSSWSRYCAIFNTIDGGNNWVVVKDSIPEELCDIYADNNVAWFCGERGVIYNCEDDNLEKMIKGCTKLLSDIDFVNEQCGWVVGEKGTVLSTINSGDTWNLQNTNTKITLSGVDFISTEQGWATGSSVKGIIIHTEDKGQSWTVQYQNSSSRLRDICFTDSLNGWAVGYNGKILNTTDGGQNWTEQISNTDQVLAKVFFIDKNRGWTCGYNGTMLFTSNGGDNWQNQFVPNGGFLRNLQFVDGNIGWCSNGDENGFFKTTNGGVTWEEIPLENWAFSLNGVQSFYFIDENIGFAGGFLFYLRNTTGVSLWMEVSAVLCYIM